MRQLSETRQRDLIAEARSFVASRLKGTLLTHSLNTASVARELALLYGADPEKAELVALVHDCAKDFSKDDLLKQANELGLEAAAQRIPLEVLHGPVGARIVQRALGIDDPEVLAAIAHHSTGAASMTEMAKVVFVADYIEPSREFPGTEEARRVARQGLNEAVLCVLVGKITWVMEKRLRLDTQCVAAWNFVLGQIEQDRARGRHS